MSQSVVQWLQGHVSVLMILGGTVTGALRFAPRFFLEIVIVCTGDENRRLACLELIRLRKVRRRDAAKIPPYLPKPADLPKPGTRRDKGRSGGPDQAGRSGNLHDQRRQIDAGPGHGPGRGPDTETTPQKQSMSSGPRSARSGRGVNKPSG